MIRPGTESTNFARHLAVYAAIPGIPKSPFCVGRLIDRALATAHACDAQSPRGALGFPGAFH